jgi:hypothetical protein
MKSILIISLSFVLLAGCAKYNEEQGCFERPSYKVCDAVDGPPSDLNLQIKLLGSFTYPVKIKIYNRSLTDGIGTLYTTFTQYTYNETYLLPEGRYTAELIYTDQTTSLNEFRVYVEKDTYCDGDCYEKHNAVLEIQKPLQ